MQQLSALDVQFLNIENSTNQVHVAGLMIVDPSTRSQGRLTREDMCEHIEQRLHLLAPFRRRLATTPLRLDYPYWIEAPEFDLDFHVREVAIPAPGDDRRLADLVARLHERPLDRSRPLWELYVIEGLEGGRTAIYTKIHHAAIDGVSGAEILTVLLDPTPEPRPIPPPEKDWKAETPPSALDMMRRSTAHFVVHPVRSARTLSRTLPHLAELPGGNVPGFGLLTRLGDTAGRLTRLAPRKDSERPHLAAPRTPFNGSIGAHRRFAFGSLSLAEVKEVKGVFGLTVNDVVMALCASALRRWLIDHRALPDVPLVAAVPVSVRTEEEMGSGGNRISVMFVPLPTHIADPAERLRAIHEATGVAKERFNAMPASLLQDYSAMMPAALSGLAARATLRLAALAGPAFNLFVSNVPGPQMPLYIAGARILGHYPVSVVTDAGGGLNITVQSFDGHLDFGLIAGREMVPDVWMMIDYLREALEELRILAGKHATDTTTERSR